MYTYCTVWQVIIVKISIRTHVFHATRRRCLELYHKLNSVLPESASATEFVYNRAMMPLVSAVRDHWRACSLRGRDFTGRPIQTGELVAAYQMYTLRRRLLCQLEIPPGIGIACHTVLKSLAEISASGEARTASVCTFCYIWDAATYFHIEKRSCWNWARNSKEQRVFQKHNARQLT